MRARTRQNDGRVRSVGQDRPLRVRRLHDRIVGVTPEMGLVFFYEPVFVAGRFGTVLEMARVRALSVGNSFLPVQASGGHVWPIFLSALRTSALIRRLRAGEPQARTMRLARLRWRCGRRIRSRGRSPTSARRSRRAFNSDAAGERGRETEPGGIYGHRRMVPPVRAVSGCVRAFRPVRALLSGAWTWTHCSDSRAL